MAGRALNIQDGGTGQTTAEGARIAFGLGPNNDVTFNSLTVNTLTTGTLVATTLSMSGDIDMNGNDIQDGGDIFLQSGKKIDWGTGDVIIQHAANALTFTGANTYTFDGGSTQVPFIIQQTDDGASAGPNIRLERISTTPAASDLIGSIDFVGRDSGGAQQRYARLSGHILDPSAGGEDGTIRVNLTINAVDTAMYSFDIASFRPITTDAASLGLSGNQWADLFLATGGVINWNAGDVTITHSANLLALAGASSGYTFDAGVLPSANDAAALGASGTAWSDLFLASGGVVNFNAGNVTLTHSAAALTMSHTDDSATSGPAFIIDRGTANAANNDRIGIINFQGRSSTGVNRAYAYLNAKITDTTNTTEDSELYLANMVNGANVEQLTLNSTGVAVTNVLTLGTGLILPQASSPTPTAEGDLRWDTDDNLLVIGDGANSRRMSNWELISATTIGSVTNIDFTNLSGFRTIRIMGYCRPATDGAALQLRTSTNNGSSYDSGATDYVHSFVYQSGAAAGGTDGANDTRMLVQVTGAGNAAPEACAFDCKLFEFNQSVQCFYINQFYNLGTTTASTTGNNGGRRTSTTARNAFRLNWSSGDFAAVGSILVWGHRGA